MGLQEAPYFSDGNIEVAHKLFREALGEKEFPEVSFIYVASERNHLIAQALQQQWFNAFGVLIRLDALECKVYYDRLYAEDFQLAASSWVADFNDPLNFLEPFKYKSNVSNNTTWENNAYAQLLDKVIETTDVSQRLELLKQSEKILMDEMPLIPIFHYNMLCIAKDNLKEVLLSPTGNIDFRWAILEPFQEISR